MGLDGTVSPVATAAIYVTFPVVAAVVGSAIAAVRRPGEVFTSAVQHLAAGIVLAAVVGEILPELRNEGRLPWAVAGFALGVAVMLTLGAYGRRVDAQRAGAAPVGFLVAVGIDLLLDGLLVGLAVQLGSTQGLILTIALTLEVLFLALSVVGELTDRGFDARRAALICAGLGLLTAVGAIAGALVLGGVGPTGLAFGLAFGAAALLYLAIEELIAEAHGTKETTLLSGMFFLGFLVIYVLAELGG